ncbi:MAG TPA: biopolymer transporter ExbD [Chthoniobacteraceae bacterium]|jgi:biopolymer transport protein ExbD|nr:biopolymer transporter ExbD [Chthoniobacteraceae bacterium]
MTHAALLKKKRAETRLPPEEDPEFQIAPMIDILLVLLVFFMSISSTEVLQTRDDITLPVAKDAKEKDKQTPQGQVIINVLWNELIPGGAGTVDLDGKTYANPADIGPMLKAKVDKQPEVRVVIRADRKVRYEYLRNLIKTAGNNRVQNVTFSVTDKDSTGPATP